MGCQISRNVSLHVDVWVAYVDVWVLNVEVSLHVDVWVLYVDV